MYFLFLLLGSLLFFGLGDLGALLRLGGTLAGLGDLDFVGEDDVKVAGALADGTGGATGAGLEALEGGAVADGGLLDGELVCDQLVVVLRVGNGALERFADKLGGFARGVCEGIEGVRDWHALDGTGDITSLLGRDAGVFVSGFYFHRSS